jgi:hypothetical protein
MGVGIDVWVVWLEVGVDVRVVRLRVIVDVWLDVGVDVRVVRLGVVVDVWVVWRRASELDLVRAIVDSRRSSVDVLRH